MNDHSPDHPLFVVRAFPNGLVDVAVCWDQMNTREVVKALRSIAASLEGLPPDTSAEGVIPL